MKVLIVLLAIFFMMLTIPQLTYASCYSDCIAAGNTPTECRVACGGEPSGIPENPGITGGLGKVTNPIKTSSSVPGGGLIILLNNILRLVFTGAGIYAFIRIVIAGLGFISAGGDVKKITSAWNSIWQSLLGLVIIIGSIALAALIGQILYGNPGAILHPTIYGPGL